MTTQPETRPVLYVQFADNGHIRKWSPEPFDGGVRYDAQAPLVEALAYIADAGYVDHQSGDANFEYLQGIACDALALAAARGEV